MFKRVLVTVAAAAAVLGGAAPSSAQQFVPCHGESSSSCPICINLKGDLIEVVYCVLNFSQAQPAADGTP